MTQTSATLQTTAASARNLVRAGAAAGPLYLILGYAQALLRDGFDMRRHALSNLSLGDLGWIQVATFLLCGILVIAGAVGLRRTMQRGRGRLWGPILLAVYGIGLIGAGIFKADPANGFPPGSVAPTTMTQSGLMHFVFGGIGFYALIAACFVFARRFKEGGEGGWAVYSIVSGLLFFVSFAAIASGSTSAAVMLGFYGAVTWIWIWHMLLHVRMSRALAEP